MKNTPELNQLFLLLRERNRQLKKLHTLIEPDVKKSAEKKLERIKKDIDRKTKEIALSTNRKDSDNGMLSFSKLATLKEKYSQVISDANELEKYIRYSISRGNKSSKREPWVNDATDCFNALNDLDKEYVKAHQQALVEFLYLIKKTTLQDLTHYCKNNNAPLDRAAESKTGLMFSIATKDEALSADYLVNLAGLSMPPSQDLALTLTYLIDTVTDERIQPLLEDYERNKTSNPVESIANLLHALRDHLVILDKNGTSMVHENALRVLYNRECFLAGIPPKPITAFEMTRENILSTLKAATSANIKLSENNLFSPQTTPENNESSVPNPAPRR